jgi:hypothetical protein
VIGFGALDQILRQDAKVVGPALEAGNEDEDGVRLRCGGIELEAGVARMVQVGARSELGEELLVGDRNPRAAGRVRRLRAARDVDRGHRRTGAGCVAQARAGDVGSAVALLAEIDHAVAAVHHQRRPGVGSGQGGRRGGRSRRDGGEHESQQGTEERHSSSYARRQV